MRQHPYVWLQWSLAFLVPWAAVYAGVPALRRHMLKVSAATSLLGLTEPIFVPGYWNPPSLFDLAQRTGFDIESFIFCFAIGGMGSALYSVLTRGELRPVPVAQRDARRHRFHVLALLMPYLSFPALYLLPWSPIYPAIVALVIGAAATMVCRPELVRSSLLGGVLFAGLYAVFVGGLVLFAPGYIDHVWNLPALSGVLVFDIPIEELAFGLAFGMYWSGLYEHFFWRAAKPGSVPLSASPSKSLLQARNQESFHESRT